MTAYAIAHLQTLQMGPDIVRYLEAIDATLVPFEGRFLVHGARAEALEGEFPGDLVVIEFPDRRRAEEWYASDAYQAILPLRTNHSAGWAILVDGAGRDHKATDVLEAA